MSICLHSLSRSVILSTASCLLLLAYPSVSVSPSLSHSPSSLYSLLFTFTLSVSPSVSPVLPDTYLPCIASMLFSLFSFLPGLYILLIIPFIRGIIFHTCAHSILSTHTSTQPSFFLHFLHNFSPSKTHFQHFSCYTLP